MNAEGWYQDPFGAHEARWFSDGHPTPLVRDGSVESHDEPPDTQWDLPLVSVADHQASDGSDLRRVGVETSDDLPGDGPFQAFGASGGSFT
jgi:hypothetical protein